MKFLITGGSGLLGANTAKFFSQKKDWDVVVETRRNLKKIKKYLPKCSFVKFKWGINSDIKKKIKNKDIIIHFAGLNSEQCEKELSKARNFNIYESQKLFKSAIQIGAKKFIFISSAHVYGKSLKNNVNEDTIPLPSNNYGLLKYITEKKLSEIYEKSEKKTQLVILRVSNVFGTPILNDTNCWNLVFPNFAKQAIKENKIILKSNPLIKRNFLPMNQFLKMLNYVVIKKSRFSKTNIINIGSKWSPTLGEVADKINKRFKFLYSKQLKIVYMRNNIISTKKIKYSSKIKFIKQFEKRTVKTNKEIDNLIKYCSKVFSND